MAAASRPSFVSGDLPTVLEASGCADLLPFADELLRCGFVSAFDVFETAEIGADASILFSPSRAKRNESSPRLGAIPVSKTWRRF